MTNNTKMPKIVKIKCINKCCTAPDGIFEYDVNQLGASGPAGPDSENTAFFIIKCPYCETMNKVRLERTPMAYRTKGASYSIGGLLVDDRLGVADIDFR
jgi:hypothetical protein